LTLIILHYNIVHYILFYRGGRGRYDDVRALRQLIISIHKSSVCHAKYNSKSVIPIVYINNLIFVCVQCTIICTLVSVLLQFFYIRNLYTGLREVCEKYNLNEMRTPLFLNTIYIYYIPIYIYNITGRDGQLNNDMNRYYINMELKNRIGMR